MSKKNYYLEEKYIPNLLSYKYHGADNSILYNYIISPFCNFLVDYFPEWLTPNAITISGFFSYLLNVIITIYYTGWKGGEYIPPWACYACAIFYLLYQLLDNCDGKQARKLKASSPLGLLVDHSTDACLTFFFPIFLGPLLYCSTIYEYAMLYIMLTAPFFFATWEQYLTGYFSIPAINGANEGTVLSVIFMILSGIYGSSLFLKKINIFGIVEAQINDIIAFCSMIGGIFFTFLNFISVFNIINKKDIKKALYLASIYLFFIASFFSIILLNESTIAEKYPKFLLLSFGFGFSKMLGLFQLAHVVNSPYDPFYKGFSLPLLICLIHSLFFWITGFNFIVSIDVIIAGCFIWYFCYWVHCFYYCSEELCEALNINVFVLGKRHP